MPSYAAPPAFHVMAKPSGSACSLCCDYRFFLKKGKLYPGSDSCMSDKVHETYIGQLLEAHQVPGVTGAPKSRFVETPDGEPGLNYLCSGTRPSSRMQTGRCG